LLQSRPDVIGLYFRLMDRFGDNGLISVVILVDDGSDVEIDTWLMSCRVLGRRVEEAVLAEVVDHARAAGARRLVGRYIATERNELVRDHYLKLGFVAAGEVAGSSTTWLLELADYAAPSLPMQVRRVGV
jgi:FkbH-like protein